MANLIRIAQDSIKITKEKKYKIGEKEILLHSIFFEQNESYSFWR